MYERYFGFSSKPFSLTPDPGFLYLSHQHAMAMTMLEYGLKSQAGFMLLTGEIGSGKTTLVRRLLRSLGDQVVVGLISNTHSSFTSIHAWALSALGLVAPSSSPSDQYETLVNSFVKEYGRGRRTLLIIDEAQNLSANVLEELRLLSNVNSETDLVLQVLLVGQPELRDTLLRPELQQFAQRVALNYHLRSLDRAGTHAYIQHRLSVAGASSELFRPEAVECLYAHTNGVPRLLNQMCDMALVYAYADSRRDVDLHLVLQVARDRGIDKTSLAGPIRNLIAAPRGATDDIVA